MNLVVGNVFDYLSEPGVILAHVVNDQHGWGRGISGQIGARFPRAAQEYRAWTKDFYLGQNQYVRVRDGLYVANMLAQRGYKSDLNPTPCDLDALWHCLRRLALFADASTYEVVLPQVGTGLGGQDWEDVALLIERFLPDATVVQYDGH